MSDDAPSDDLVVDQAFINKVKKNGGRELDFLLELSRDQLKKLTDEHVIRIINEHFTANAITRIKIGYCTGITDSTFVHFSTKCTSLQELYVYDCVNITDVGIKAVVEKIGDNLRILAYGGCNQCTNAAFQAVAKNCPNLEHLYFKDTGITKIPETLGQDFPKLKRLNLSNNGIKAIPQSITLLKDVLSKFEINDNPLRVPPLKTAEEGFHAICEYFEELQTPSIGPTTLDLQQDAAHVNADGGISDSPDFDPDRLGRNAYAEGISTVARAIESPNTSICIGLYGRWGSGKSFLHKLIMKADEAWMGQKLGERLTELQKEPKSFLFKCNERSLQFSCDAIHMLVLCCCCFQNSNPSRIARHQQAKSIATLCALFFPLWTCLYLVRLLVCLIKGLFVSIKNSVCSKSTDSNHSDPQEHEYLMDEVPTDLLRSKPSWTDVRDVLTGDAPIYSDGTPWSCCSFDTFQLLVLSSTQTFFRIIGSILTRSSEFFPTFLCCMKPLKEDDELRKPIYIQCNAWLYNGTDLLWASILEEIWNKVEEEFGTFRVRFHRFTIEISGESETDDRKVKEKKRNIAVIKFALKQILYLILAIAITVLITTYNDQIEDFTGSVYRRYILNIALYASPAFLFLRDAWKIFIIFSRSKGAWILEQARSLEKHHRADLSQKTGFMGIVKIEVSYLKDFLKTQYITDWKHQLKRLARLFILVDDLDRCDVYTIMNVLQAVMLLLLGDAPFTILLAIDSRVIVASIEKYFGEHFREVGIDGFSFLDKIVQLPFCIPDLDIRRKTKFLRTIFEKKELNPVRICERLKHWGIDKAYPEFVKLVPEFIKSNKPFPEKDDLVKELAKVLDEMIKMQGILEHDDDAEACFSSPSDVLNKVNARVKYQEILGDQLEEEFLSYISSGIQEILSNRSRTTVSGSPIPPEVVSTPSFSREGAPRNRQISSFKEFFGKMKETISQAPRVVPEPTTSDIPPSTSPPLTSPISPIAVLSDPPDEEVTNLDELYNPMMDNLETKWFNEYADQIVGEPRKMKRIINCYMVSRIIANKLSPKLTGSADGDFRRKLMKMIILFEQWPYRMAWLMVIVENIQQELSLKKKPNRENGNPIGSNLTNIISNVFGTVEEEEIMSLPLLDVYYQIVQTLIRSPSNANAELLRDGDEQDFEILLAETDAQLEVKDIASISCGRQDKPGLEKTIRPYVFNLQMHMIEKVEKYVDNCMIHAAEDNKQQGLKFGVYQPKETFFNQDYPM